MHGNGRVVYKVACVEVKISGSFVFFIQNHSGAPPSSGERYLRCFVKTGIKCSIEFAFNVDCGGSGQIRMV